MHLRSGAAHDSASGSDLLRNTKHVTPSAPCQSAPFNFCRPACLSHCRRKSILFGPKTCHLLGTLHILCSIHFDRPPENALNVNIPSYQTPFSLPRGHANTGQWTWRGAVSAMFLRTYRRSPLRRLFRLLFYLVTIFLFYDLLTILKHHREFSQSLEAHTYTDIATLPSPVKDQKIFIVAQFWTNAKVIQDRWGQALLDLIQALGKENVYVSIYESGSLDRTKDVLKVLDDILAENKIPRSVILDPTTHADEINVGPIDQQGNPRSGWIQTTTVGAGKELRRIPYLSRLRNTSLKPLFDHKAQGITYDKILYLNDVVFRPADVLTLLATNQGSYASACAMDFHYPPAYYDTFVLRDSLGDSTVMKTFPFFRSQESREAILQGRPTKVQSCWNGMIILDTAPFYEGLRFRALPDSLASKHLEASECCLIHTDMAAMGATSKGIYLNPSVRVGYTINAYNLTHFGPDQNYVSGTQYLVGVWLNRIKRNFIARASKTMKETDRKVTQWKKDAANSLEKRDENGKMCIIDEQHILIWNGWKHV